MVELPEIVAIDYETTGLDFWSPDFQVKSFAAAYRYGPDKKITTKFFDTIDDIKKFLETLKGFNIPIIVYNFGFEYPVSKGIGFSDLNWHCDVMRLVQMWGATNDPDRRFEIEGFGLKAATRRLLPREYGDYEREAYTWLQEKYPKIKKNELGALLGELPRSILERYNTADAINTLLIYEKLTTAFKTEGFDWTYDWRLYRGIGIQVTDAQRRGVLVNRALLADSIAALEADIDKIQKEFIQTFETEILTVREKLKEKAQSKFKKKVVTTLPEFKITSTKQKEMLFCEVLGLTARFLTKTGKPSFGKKHLFQWGVGGKILKNLGKQLIALKQCQALLYNSEKDSRWHLGLKLTGTKTGRLSGNG